MQNNSTNRKRAGIGTNVIGILCNLVLSVAKIAVGMIFGLVSVVADGVNNLSDMGSSAVSLVSFCIAEKPADEKHPYGHRRAEYVATMATGFIILLVAVELLRESISKIIEGTLTSGSPVIYGILTASIVVKLGMFVFYRIMAGKLNSDSLKAASIDSVCDCIATLAVIIGVVVTQFSGKPTDGWFGIVVALFIAWQGIKILYEQGSKLIGQAASPELAENIKELILSSDGVLGIHDLHIFSYGEGKNFATVHISINADTPSLEAHTILDDIESRVLAEYDVNLTAHLDPVDMNDGEALQMEEEISALIPEIADGIKLHDFRLIRGAKTKVVFDVCVPYSVKLSDEEIRSRIEEKISSICAYQPIVTVDRE